MPIDRNSLPKDPEILQQMLVDLTTQLDKTQRLLGQLLAVFKSSTRSEQLSADQLRLFAQELGDELPNAAPKTETTDPPKDGDDLLAWRRQRRKPPSGTAPFAWTSETRADRARSDGHGEKYCSLCRQDLRPIGEEASERYEYIPAQLLVIEDICKKYACAILLVETNGNETGETH